MISFEFRIPILPQPSFFSNVKLAAMSLAKLGGRYAEAPIVVSLGAHIAVDDLIEQNRWAESYPIVWRPAPAQDADRVFSAGLDRFVEPPRGDVVIMIDADACLMAPIDDLLQRLVDNPGPMVAGLTAHFSPFSPRGDENDACWRAVLENAGLTDVPLNQRYSESPADEHGGCPPYFNYGFVAMNRSAYCAMAPRIHEMTPKVASFLAGQPNVYFAGQIALTIAILSAGCDVLALGPEFNCPNSDEMLRFGLDVGDIRVMHYLRADGFNRHNFLCDGEKFDLFRATVFSSPVIEAFREHVLTLPGVYFGDGR